MIYGLEHIVYWFFLKKTLTFQTLFKNAILKLKRELILAYISSSQTQDFPPPHSKTSSFQKINISIITQVVIAADLVPSPFLQLSYFKQLLGKVMNFHLVSYSSRKIMTIKNALLGEKPLFAWESEFHEMILTCFIRAAQILDCDDWGRRNRK